MLEVQQLLCQLVVKQKSKLSDLLSTALLHNQDTAPRRQHAGLASTAVPVLASVPCGIFQFSLVLFWEGRGVHSSLGSSITQSFQQLAELVSLKFFHSKFVI